MKNILAAIAILMLLPLCAMSQSRQSKQLYKTGVELYDAEKYADALPYFQKSDSLDKLELKPASKNYHRALLKIADCHERLAENSDEEGNFAEALRHQTITTDIYKRVYGDNHPNYASEVWGLSTFYYYTGNYTEAVRLVKIAMEIQKKTLGEMHPDYAESLCELASYYEKLGNNNESIRLGNIALEIRKKILGEDSEDCLQSLINLASAYANNGDYMEAIKKQTTAIETVKKYYGEDNEYYITSLNNLAVLYVNICNYSESIRLGNIVLEKSKNLYGVKHPLYAIELSNQAEYYYKLGDCAEAIRLENIAMQIIKDRMGETHPEYAKSLFNLALFYSKTGNYNEAIRLGNLAADIRKKVLGEQHPDYAISLSVLAENYCMAGDYTEAIKLENAALKIRKNVLGEGNIHYYISLHNLAGYYMITDNYDKASDYFEQSYKLAKSFVLKNFFSMTNKERTNLWNNLTFIREKLPYAAYRHPDSTLSALAYDSQVFSKGLLLNAELEIQKLIEQSGDTSLANCLYKIKQDRATLDELYRTSAEDREMDADSLQKAIDNAERLLVESSKSLGDYTKNLSISWKDVQKKLKDSELAIEFATVKDTATKQQVYIALVLKKGMTSPELIKLFESYDFWDVRTKEYYTTPKLYNLVWKPLAEYLKDAKTVYFAPAGQLHTIGIEYLSNENGDIFAEQYDTYRLSSTRELAMEHAINPNKKATTYGGIRYDFTEEDWNDLQDRNDSIQRSFRDIPKMPDNLRGGSMVYLEGTKLESAQIAALLRTADYRVNEMSDIDATEESFKMLSGSGIKVLHIGTHGFYESEGDMENAGYKFYTATQQSDEDRSLSCSGLLFAGANSALNPSRANEIPEGADDGVLTAKEISRMDFQGLDLVVLSACQTGLGEITGEGVFGLQRGFKKAGVQTIVMSLWKVADEPTQMLMVEFFKNLTAGQSKRAAFLAAQKAVRQKYPNPLYWAAFVMVDGI